MRNETGTRASFLPNVQGHLVYSLKLELVLISIIKGTLIEKDHLESGEGLLLVTDVSTTCAEAIFRGKW